MATLKELAETLRRANPENAPMALQWMAEQLWPDAPWLKVKARHHNGGPRTGGRVAGGMAGRMEKAGLLRMCRDEMQRCYVLTEASNAKFTERP